MGPRPNVTRESNATTAPKSRMRLSIGGAVQGVGFRPFVYRLATELGLTGWVQNATQGVLVEIEGNADLVEQFLQRLVDERPPHSFFENVEQTALPLVGDRSFDVRISNTSGLYSTRIAPDLATCADCLREIFDSANRRFRYPFASCVNCGPRFSILEAIPYDRDHTTMKRFPLCERCQGEFQDPGDRRFHHQANACAQCGPRLELWNAAGQVLASENDALLAAATALREGKILALKGLGGYQLLVDARNQAAVCELRRRKAREEKPFALMLTDLDMVHRYCEPTALEFDLLQSPQAPIVLLRRAATQSAHSPLTPLADAVAPGNPYLGVMLPYTPLHHLLLADLGFPVVATSGNLAEEPICIDEGEALSRLGKVADLFLTHNRPIARRLDDSVARIALDRPMILRAARGYAPVTLPLPGLDPCPPLVAVGAHLKNTIAMTVGQRIIVSQHIGDLETLAAEDAFQHALDDLPGMYQIRPGAVACDAHPDYASTRIARRRFENVVPIQHHEAHVRSCMADNGLSGSALGVVWDGTGWGPDGAVWGGEFFDVDGSECRRVAHFRYFRLPGGDEAVRQPRRAALGLLYEVFGEKLFDREELAPVRAFLPSERRILGAMLAKGLHSPWTSSVGRLFDAVASLCELRQVVGFEGQAAMDLEYAQEGIECDVAYSFAFGEDGVLDWRPLVEGIVFDLGSGSSAGLVSARFHGALAAVVVTLACQFGRERVVLSGGCFQNRSLLERTVRGLAGAGFEVYWHLRLPTNDGGVAAGQIVGAAYQLQKQLNRNHH